VSPRFLLDTHVVIRWLSSPKKLSSEQIRGIREAVRRGEAVALSAYSLVEIAVLAQSPRTLAGTVRGILNEVEANPLFLLLPITFPIAADAAALALLRDPGDRIIVATARVHGLRLLTSDQRIIDSKLVSVID
jgi:PIN domain nuclease of toxin-antitoxin system